MEGLSKELSAAADTALNQSIVRFNELSDHLIPGLPNNITLEHIVTKLPWSSFHNLPAVSRVWQQAVRSKEARLTETLIMLNTQLHNLAGGYEEGLLLYSTRDKCSYQLRLPFTFCSRLSYKCVSLDGKVYLLVVQGHLRDRITADMYVLDIMAVAKREWKQCASVQGPSFHFGDGFLTLFACGVYGGKIYVFDEDTDDGCVGRRVSVYAPQTDTWTEIAPLGISPLRSRVLCLRMNYEVATIGEEIFVYGGVALDQFGGHKNPEFSLDVYHPATNVWRVVEPFGVPFRGESSGSDRWFVVNGNFYSCRMIGNQRRHATIHIHDHDVGKNSWTELHSFSTDLPNVFRNQILACEGELFIATFGATVDEFGLSESTGFGGKNKRLVWNRPISFKTCLGEPFMSTVKLRYDLPN